MTAMEEQYQNKISTQIPSLVSPADFFHELKTLRTEIQRLEPDGPCKGEVLNGFLFEKAQEGIERLYEQGNDAHQEAIYDLQKKIVSLETAHEEALLGLDLSNKGNKNKVKDLEQQVQELRVENSRLEGEKRVAQEGMRKVETSA